MGSVGASKTGTYTRGKDTYSVSYNDKDKRYYLNIERPLNNGETSRERYRIAYAKDDDKAEIYVKSLREVIKLNSDPNILKLLQDARAKREGSSNKRFYTPSKIVDDKFRAGSMSQKSTPTYSATLKDPQTGEVVYTFTGKTKQEVQDQIDYYNKTGNFSRRKTRKSRGGSNDELPW